MREDDRERRQLAWLPFRCSSACPAAAAADLQESNKEAQACERGATIYGLKCSQTKSEPAQRENELQ